MERLGVVELRQALSDVLNRVEYKGERVVIHRRDKDAAVLIPLEDLALLERLIAAEEDRIDAAAAEAAEREPGESAPYSQVRRRLGLGHGTKGRAKAIRG